MKKCPECGLRLFEYESGQWLEWICWRCGHYESNSPAFKDYPELFKNLARENPFLFFTKVKAEDAKRNLTERKFRESNGDWTEPLVTKFISLEYQPFIPFDRAIVVAYS